VGATRLGQLLFAVAIAVLGAFNLAWSDFSYVWQPLPKWLPWRVPLADLSGVILVVLGIGMLLPRTARLATLLLTANMGIWLLLTKLPSVLAAPGIEVRWEQLGETTMLLAGGWCLLAALSRGESRRSWLDGSDGVRLARLVYAVALPMMGLSHFFYLKFTASMIPGWIPFHVAFACLTGAGHIAAGLGLLFGVLPRLAATAEAAMISIFVLFANSAAVIGQPGSHDQWAELFVAIAIAGAAWAIAGSLDGAPWGLRSSPPQPAA
jgi:uncharacterized membrane protein